MGCMFCKSESLPKYTPLEMVEIDFPKNSFKGLGRYCVLADSRVRDLKFLIEEDCNMPDRYFLLALKDNRHISDDETIRSLIPRYDLKTHVWRLNLRVSLDDRSY